MCHPYLWHDSFAINTTHPYIKWLICEWGMSHIWMSDVTHMNESCYTYEWVIPHVWRSHSFEVAWFGKAGAQMSHVAHVNSSCHACEWVMSRMWMNHVCAHIFVRIYRYSFAAQKWGCMSNIQMRHVTHTQKTWHTHEWVMLHIWRSHVSHKKEWHRTGARSRHAFCERFHRYSSVAQGRCSSSSWNWGFAIYFGRSLTWQRNTSANDDTQSGRWMSHVTHVSESCGTNEWVMSLIWVSHVTHMSESWHTYEWVMSHPWVCHVTHVSESCHASGWVMSQMWESHVTHESESCHTCEWVISHTWMGHVSHTDESCRTYAWRVRVWHDPFTCETWLIHMYIIYVYIISISILLYTQDHNMRVCITGAITQTQSGRNLHTHMYIYIYIHIYL